VRTEIERPFKEEDYAGPVTPAPPRSAAFDHKNWIYGMEKRAAEDVLIRGWAERQFPVTIRRLSMVNSERDHLNRIYGYFLRLRDGGPILLPVGVDLPLRHVYGEDVVQAISRLAGSDTGRGRAYNLSQDETVPLEEFLATMAELAHKRLRVVRLPRERLNEAGLLPDCSPFSDPWMSAVENARSKAELGIRFTPLATYLECLIHSFEDGPLRVIDGYSRRGLELQLANA
jgi:nucleoside-diphosphate-sugar epimerase